MKPTLIFRRICKLFSFLVPIVLFILLLPVNDSDDTRRIQDFYLEEPGSLDVVFFGSSDVYAGFSPVLAYEEFGFTSYPYVTSSNYAGMLPYQIQDVHTTQSPKLLVIEITEALNQKPGSFDHRLREYLAGIPSLSRRMELARILGKEEHRYSYLSPFFSYHGSQGLRTLWENGQRNHLVRSRGYSLLKGTLTYTGFGEDYVPPINTTDDLTQAELLDHVEENFRELLPWLRENGYDNVLFLTFPHLTPNEDILFRHHLSNAAGALIRSYGYDYINLDSCLDPIGIIPETDFLDNEHLNLRGQYKNTRYLCRILADTYGIGKSELSPEVKAQWDTCVAYQKDYEALFEENFQPLGSGIWLKENAELLMKLEERKK